MKAILAIAIGSFFGALFGFFTYLVTDSLTAACAVSLLLSMVTTFAALEALS